MGRDSKNPSFHISHMHFYFGNILGWSDDPFAIQNSSDLLQAQSILLNSQGGIDSAETVRPAQHSAIICPARNY